MRNRTHAHATRVSPDGRTHHLEALEFRRLLSGGLPDPSFGSGGIVLTPFLVLDALSTPAAAGVVRVVVTRSAGPVEVGDLAGRTAEGSTRPCAAFCSGSNGSSRFAGER